MSDAFKLMMIGSTLSLTILSDHPSREWLQLWASSSSRPCRRVATSWRWILCHTRRRVFVGWMVPVGSRYHCQMTKSAMLLLNRWRLLSVLLVYCFWRQLAFFRIHLRVNIASSTVLNVLSSFPSRRLVSRRRDWKKPRRRTNCREVQSLPSISQSDKQAKRDAYVIGMYVLYTYPSFPFPTVQTYMTA
jgi:hypothetical protein